MSRNRKYNYRIKGHPLTNQRRLLLELLRKAKVHIDAKELYLQALAKNESISLATVYRNLNLFKKMNLVEETRLGKIRCVYEIKKPHEHQHLLCQGCGKIIEFRNDYFRKLIESVKTEHKFRITKAEICLEGYCSKCSNDKSDE